MFQSPDILFYFLFLTGKLSSYLLSYYSDFLGPWPYFLLFGDKLHYSKVDATNLCSHPTCSACDVTDASPTAGTVSPTLRFGWRLVTVPAHKVGQKCSYRISEAVIKRMQLPPGSLPWDTRPWDPNCSAGEPRWRGQVGEENHAHGAPAIPIWENPPGCRRSSEDAFAETPSQLLSDCNLMRDPSQNRLAKPLSYFWPTETDCCPSKLLSVGPICYLAIG